MSHALRQQFDRAKREGWLSYFAAAATRYEVRPDVLLAIASRESDMGGPLLPDGSFKYLAMPGDKGNGYGLMQIDRRSFPEWIDTGAWRRADAGIHKGASVLYGMRQGLLSRKGQVVSVRDSKTRIIYKFTMPALEGSLLDRVAIASYNAGDWAPYHYAKRSNPDAGTTGKNYSADVLGRAGLFRQWLAEASAEAVSV